MCIGVPGQVLAVGEDIHQLAQVEVCGIKRDVNIALICEGNPADLLGQWVLVHVGFAMSIIDTIAGCGVNALSGLDGLLRRTPTLTPDAYLPYSSRNHWRHGAHATAHSAVRWCG